MQRLKIMTIVGTRPEIIKLSRVIAALDQHTQHCLVHTGQNFDDELNAIFFRELEIRRPDYYLNAADKNTIKTIGQVLVKTDDILEKERPDAVLVYGDTNSCLAILAAKRRKIPIFHMEAGNRCFDQRVPEEINRKMIDHLSDINLTLSEQARRYLLTEGLRPELVMKIGSSMKEVFSYYMPGIQASTILKTLSLSPRQYFIVSLHREENIDVEDNLLELLSVLNLVAKNYRKKIIVSTHPRLRQRLETLRAAHVPLVFDPDIQFLRPFGFLDYAHLQKESFCGLSDSGSLTEDASILGFPAVSLRETHERPEGMDAGVLIMGGLKKERVMQAIDIVTSRVFQQNKINHVADYEADNVAEKVVGIIHSYVDYVNRVIWQKTPATSLSSSQVSYSAAE